MQAISVGQSIGRFSCTLFFLKSPHRHTFVFTRWNKFTGRVARKTIFIAQPNGRIGLKRVLDQRKNFSECFIQIPAGSQRSGQPIQRGGTFFATTLGLLALAQFCRQVTDNECDHEIGAEHQEVMKVGDVKREARGDEEKIPK